MDIKSRQTMNTKAKRDIKRSNLGLTFKIKERRKEFSQVIRLKQDHGIGYSNYIMNYIPEERNFIGKHMVSVVYSAMTSSGVYIPSKSGNKTYYFSDPVKAVGFFLKKKREKIRKGYKEF